MSTNYGSTPYDSSVPTRQGGGQGGNKKLDTNESSAFMVSGLMSDIKSGRLLGDVMHGDDQDEYNK